MKKIFISILLSLFIICSLTSKVYADDLNFSSIDRLNNHIETMATHINHASSHMMMFADMLICHALHGEASYTSFSVPGIISINIHLVCLDILLSGVVLLALGFCIMLIASFYMFDVAFNISITVVLLPLGLALWPFGWTRDKLKPMIDSIAYYTGLFIFLPLGIFLGRKLVDGVADSSIQNTPSCSGMSFVQAFDAGNSDCIRDNFGVFTFGFLKILLCYIVAMRIIPLMASQFCSYFFGESLAGSPLSETITQLGQTIKNHTVGRVVNYGRNVSKHQMGNAIKSAGDKNGNFFERVIYNYGKNVAKTKKK